MSKIIDFDFIKLIKLRNLDLINRSRDISWNDPTTFPANILRLKLYKGLKINILCEG
jgi:hypothetical protein